MTVTLTVRVSDMAGHETLATHDFEVGSATPLSGDVAGTFGDAHIVGDLNLTGNVTIRGGKLTGIDTFHVQGNGFSFFFEDGGRADLHGKFKAPWGPWGTDTTGWVAGDRVAVAPNKVGVYVPSELAWSNWSMARPVSSPDFTPLGRPTRKPEVVNLGQSIVFENLSRGFHIHGSGGIQLLSDVKFLNCGTAGVLGNYPHHFHIVGENARGSLLERVVVEGGKNHAFVPHGSHGITYKDCVAYNTIGDAFWWDPPENNNLPSLNDSNDTLEDHCLVLGVPGPTVPTAHRLAGFVLGRGNNNRCINCTAVGVLGGKTSSGFLWPEVGIAAWEFTGCVSHNNRSDGIFAWPNTVLDHVVEDFIAYNFGRTGIEHGAYRTRFVYRNVSLTVTNPVGGMVANATAAIRQHANGGRFDPPQFEDVPRLLFEDHITDDRLIVNSHGLAPTAWTTYRRCQFTGVLYDEAPTGGGTIFRSRNRFEDCGFTPADFTLFGILPDSVIEIFEASVLTNRWVNGAWT